MRTLTITAALAAFTFTMGGSELAAQVPQAGQVEAGLFGQYTHFDENAGCPCEQPTDAIGFGGRLGYFFTPRLLLELDGATTNAERAIVGGDIRYSTVALRMNYNQPLPVMEDDRVSLLLGLGPVLTRYGSENEWGAGGQAGVRWGLSPVVALRVDGFADYVPDKSNWNLGTRVGLSFTLRKGGARPAAAAAPPPPPARTDTVVVVQETEPPPPPPAAPARTRETSVLEAPVYFDLDRSDLRPDAIAALEVKLPWLRANPDVRLAIEGHADVRGATDYNIPLGERRARAVRDFLVAGGIPAGRLETVSHGDLRLACTMTPTSEECHQRNRRVEFRILSGAAEGLRIPNGS